GRQSPTRPEAPQGRGVYSGQGEQGGSAGRPGGTGRSEGRIEAGCESGGGLSCLLRMVSGVSKTRPVLWSAALFLACSLISINRSPVTWQGFFSLNNVSQLSSAV